MNIYEKVMSKFVNKPAGLSITFAVFTQVPKSRCGWGSSG
jgi:hypothetical protein